jgi:hypothetical protein
VAQPIADSQGLVKPGKAGGTGGGSAGTAAGQMQRLEQSMTQVSGAIRSLANLPVETTGTVFGPKNFNSLFTAPLSALNNQFSDITAQRMKVRLAGVSRNLASLETGGAATGLVGLADKIEQGIEIGPGTPVIVAFDKLAEMRRIVDDSARAALSNPKYTEAEKDLIRQNLKIVETAIPFTLDDVDKASRASKGKDTKVPKDAKNLSFTEFVNQYGLEGKKKESTEHPDDIKALLDTYK